MKKQLTQEFALFWEQRDARERRMLSIAAAVILLALVYQIFLDPALTGRTKLLKQIPVLRQQVAEISALSAQQSKLAAGLSQMIEPITRESVEASLATRGIKAQTLSVTDDIVRLQIQTVAYANIMEWLMETQKSSRLTVEEARFTALPEPAQVNVSLTLKQQRGGL
ncbi:type II secretion system protein M [Undibacterium sp. 14-3-2]|jgi:general secretion pathway protein M|uniref:type II secretion system protein GspM n=1 Tax=Undibacterium sp. 14-3-2 TaxID=2800129 RepID=UPI001906718A|nr:type II secretion system protein GspM [Undibacterium sp. 14-3-2]MBK1891571.1 type II secretion system protein M [Undibacterium sp. 14-3-2]